MTDPWIVAAAGVFGLLIGSFLNVCALRWPRDRSVLRPLRSECTACGEEIPWFDNLPVVSWVLLRGRCRGCRAAISAQYPLVEAAAGLVWGGAAFALGPGPEALRGAVFLTLLLGIAVSDVRFYIIPDQFSVGGLLLGLGFALVAPPPGIGAAAAGAAVGFGLLWLVAWVGEKAFGREAMGGGDIKMMALIGAFLGVQGVLVSLFLAALLGTVIFGPISWRTGRLVPFGVFLALGAGAAYLWGDGLVAWYLDWAFRSG